jgi:hypothetical protein
VLRIASRLPQAFRAVVALRARARDRRFQRRAQSAIQTAISIGTVRARERGGGRRTINAVRRRTDAR